MLNTQLDYRADGQALYVRFTAVPLGQQYFLETAEDVEGHFATLRAFWREHCTGQRVHWVVNYDNFSINPKALTPEEQLRIVQEFAAQTALSMVCYGGSLLPRSRVRWLDGKLQGPLWLCETQEEAEATLRQLREAPLNPPSTADHAELLNL